MVRLTIQKALPPSLAKLLAPETSEQLSNKPRTLYQTLSRLPHDGVGARVFQTRWQSKGIQGCFWDVTRVKLKLEGAHGKAWGKLVWRGEFAQAYLFYSSCFGLGHFLCLSVHKCGVTFSLLTRYIFCLSQTSGITYTCPSAKPIYIQFLQS